MRICVSLIIFSLILLNPSSAFAFGSITIDTDPDYPTQPRITLDNSHFTAVIRAHEGGIDGMEHAIRDLIIKSVNEDQVRWYLDASSNGGPVLSATVTQNTNQVKTVRVNYKYRTVTYSIYPDSPVIKITHLSYNNAWGNLVDFGSPGGLTQGFLGEYLMYGQADYASQVREIVYHEDSYWNIVDGGTYANDPIDAGPLNYKNHIIMNVVNPDNQRGFGRVIPVFRSGQAGGTQIIKLLWGQGFENFFRAGSKQSTDLPFTSYLYTIDAGLTAGLQQGIELVDTGIASPKPTAIPTPSPTPEITPRPSTDPPVTLEPTDSPTHTPNPLPWDLNFSGEVDIYDLAIFIEDFPQYGFSDFMNFISHL